MKIGWMGLGKLGLPCALTLSAIGRHSVVGYDLAATAREVKGWLSEPDTFKRHEDGMVALLTKPHDFKVADTVVELVDSSDVIFVAVQTPHAPELGGELPFNPQSIEDFEYGYLRTAVQSLVNANFALGSKDMTIVVVSTCLPGTMHNVIKPLLPPHIKLLYNPYFIAMGTTVQDFLSPEFVLVGSDDANDVHPLYEVYKAIHNRPLKIMRIESAELTKVAYNTFISMKIVFGNVIGEICDKTAADADEVIGALSMATERVISPKYLSPGMGDGGHCHPRDNIAMSYLARKLSLSADVMGYVSFARDAQTSYLASVIHHWVQMSRMPVALLGIAYKPQSDLIGGSPSLLLSHFLSSMDIAHRLIDPHVNDMDADFKPVDPGVYVITTNHARWQHVRFPDGSIVIDPFGDIKLLPIDRFTLVRVGRK